MTDQEIKATDRIIENAPSSWASYDYFTKFVGLKMDSYSLIGKAINSLVENDLAVTETRNSQVVVMLTEEGKKFRSKRKSYSEFLKNKEIQTAKEERDENYKNLQVQDLQTKLETMNKAQLKFWHRQRWQFWLTFMIATAAFILSIINFIKSIIIR